MKEPKKKILVVEDKDGLRKTLINELKHHGFDAIGGETVDENRALLQKHKSSLALMILDMKLEEFPDYEEHRRKQGKHVTGVSLAQEVLQEHLAYRPQLIIYSAYADNSDYYKQAIDINVSVFLSKGDPKDFQRFLPLIQALILRYSFQPGVQSDIEISKILEGRKNPFEVLENFCIAKLAPALDSCLSEAVYLLIVKFQVYGDKASQNQETSVIIHSDVSGIPDLDEFDYSELHQQIFKNILREEIFKLKPETPKDEKVRKLEKFSFFQLAKTSYCKIAIGVLDSFAVKSIAQKYPLSITDLSYQLNARASFVLETFIDKMMVRWQANRDFLIENVKSLAGLSGAIQKKFTPLIPDPNPSTIEKAAKYFEQQRQFAQQLIEYHQTLDRLEEVTKSTNVARSKIQSIRLSEIVREINSAYDQMGYFDVVTFQVKSDCVIPADGKLFSQALQNLLNWAVENRIQGHKQKIEIGCSTKGRWLTIYVQEQGMRIAKSLRDTYLFEPFSSLHLAREIIEIACLGKLIDATDELETANGHLLKIILLRR